MVVALSAGALRCCWPEGLVNALLPQGCLSAHPPPAFGQTHSGRSIWLPPSHPPPQTAMLAWLFLSCSRTDFMHRKVAPAEGWGRGTPRNLGNLPLVNPHPAQVLGAGGGTCCLWGGRELCSEVLWGRGSSFSPATSRKPSPLFANPSRERWVCISTSPLMGHSSPHLVRMAPLKDWTADGFLLVDYSHFPF